MAVSGGAPPLVRPRVDELRLRGDVARLLERDEVEAVLDEARVGHRGRVHAHGCGPGDLGVGLDAIDGLHVGLLGEVVDRLAVLDRRGSRPRCGASSCATAWLPAVRWSRRSSATPASGALTDASSRAGSSSRVLRRRVARGIRRPYAQPRGRRNRPDGEREPTTAAHAPARAASARPLRVDPYAGYLADHGVRALAFDLRCFGASSCPDGGRGHATADVAAAVAELRRRGARRIALVGASMGGSVAVVAAARLHPAALVDLSGERDTTGLTPGVEADAGAAARGVTAPALFAVARGDRYVTPADMRLIARRARSTAKRVIVMPASAGHGWDMLLGTSTDWSPLAATVAAFLVRHAAPAMR